MQTGQVGAEDSMTERVRSIREGATLHPVTWHTSLWHHNFSPQVHVLPRRLGSKDGKLAFLSNRKLLLSAYLPPFLPLRLSEVRVFL